ncbi:MAG TPA: DUF6084 family protein [Terracidiphilus sp.]|jgi:hypothetical protein|nr:DUF6084 family protein [Terracidiphilus sp.]
MPDLSFQIEGVSVVPFAAIPTLAFKMQIRNADANEAIHTVALRCQIQIDVARRRYSPLEQELMLDLFGAPERWSQTLRSMLWANVNLVIPGFAGASTTADLHLPCTFDFNVAATKYFEGLTDGDIPLLVLFSGTVFYAPPDCGLQVAPISWEREARFKLPVKVWREMMDSYYPNNVWLNLRRDVFDRLYRYKMQQGVPTWEQALERMLPAELETVEKL